MSMAGKKGSMKYGRGFCCGKSARAGPSAPTPFAARPFSVQGHPVGEIAQKERLKYLLIK
jgi:hypothetical protein